jgi:hypothetical protein
MDKDAGRKIIEQIEEQILAKDSPLCWTIARELADFTVAFVVANDGQLSPAGTGTLVSFRDSHYFLTATHVWEEALKISEWIRIPLKENSPCRFAISPKEIVSYNAPIPARWNEWGPDITLLRIPPERVSSFTAVGRPFYPLSMKRELRIDCCFETTFLMGAPAIRGEFTSESAMPELQGMNVLLSSGLYSSTELSNALRSQFDFVDVLIDTSQPDVAANFEGVSGGGLWKVYIFKGTDGRTQTFKILAGLAFWQDPRNSSLLIRCHGPQSLGGVLCGLHE